MSFSSEERIYAHQVLGLKVPASLNEKLLLIAQAPVSDIVNACSVFYEMETTIEKLSFGRFYICCWQPHFWG
jgi:hypothetical protein